VSIKKLRRIMDSLDEKKERAVRWFQELQNQICDEFTAIENEGVPEDSEQEGLSDLPAGRFQEKKWNREGGGGGRMRVMNGRIFEKVGVNTSVVHGELSEEFRASIPGASENGKFWAAGISVVVHPQNPFVPAAHMNTRYIFTSKSWFGGGGDLTPIRPAVRESQKFHADLKQACDNYNKEYYPKYKQWCDEYFYLKHRDEPRGAGGIFFDSLNSGDWDTDFQFTKDVGRTFKDSYANIVRATKDTSWNEADREFQEIRRGRYVEFNLLYARGTLFGLKTGGNIEAILMSLPPRVRWP
jgi:coproporphyrinogen III oxidase